MPAEQRVVTILSTDVEGSTELAAHRGDEAARRATEAQRELIRVQVARHDGVEVGDRGDGVLISFDSPRLAVGCALGIQEALKRHGRLHPDEAVRVRIGLNAGVVLADDDAPLFGAAINGAARVMSQAKGGEILVSETVKQLAGTVVGVSFRDRGEFVLKGFPDPWRLYAVASANSFARPGDMGLWMNR